MKKLQFSVVFLVLLASCSPAYSRDIVDMFNRHLKVPERIEKIYGTSPVATYLVYALDPDLIAGLNTEPSAAERPLLKQTYLEKPVLGGWFGQGNVSNLEVLLSIHPDIIVNCSLGPSATDDKIEKALAPLQIPMVYVTVEALADYPAAFRFLGKLLDRSERGEELARYSERLLAETDAVRAQLGGSAPVRIYYAEGPKGLQSECAGSMHTQVIPLSGATNVHHCTDLTNKGMVTVSREQVLGYAPDVIITHDAEFYAGVAQDPRWLSFAAVRNGRVYKVPVQPFNWFDRPPSFMRLLGLKWLQSTLYNLPDHSGLVAEIQNFYHTFLAVDLTPAEAERLLLP